MTHDPRLSSRRARALLLCLTWGLPTASFAAEDDVVAAPPSTTVPPPSTTAVTRPPTPMAPSPEPAPASAPAFAAKAPPVPLPSVTMKNEAGSPLPRSLREPKDDGPLRRSVARPDDPTPGATSTGGVPLARRAGRIGRDPTPWKFEFHGFLRAPMRIGFGTREMPGPGQAKTTAHFPVVPDDQYLSPQYTQHNPRDWSELYFSYGTDRVRAVAAIQAFNFTDAAWTQSNAQFGISQGYAILRPNLGRSWVDLTWKVGAFDNRYGMAGRWDAGEFDTYAFGRTHAMGETGRLDFHHKKWTFTLEHGVGATRPNPSVFNTARFTLLHHAHAWVRWNKRIEVGGHYLNAWQQEEDRSGEMNVNVPDGRMRVVGPELRILGHRYGYYYAAFSHIKAEGARTVGPSIEVIHSKGGGEFALGIVDNYLDGPLARSNGNGQIYSTVGQYEHSIRTLTTKTGEFWGDGMDLAWSFYVMYNKVRSDDPDIDGIHKLKYGADVFFSALPWFGVATRYDRVQPNSRVPEQSFSVLSPRLVFRTHWITHEQISIQYSRYFYNEDTCDPMTPTLCVRPPRSPALPDGFGATSGNQDPNTRGAPTVLPDRNAVMLMATVWW